MAKTNPIGVRFDEELLSKVKDAGIAHSPQKALNLYEKSYVELIEKKIEENNRPEKKRQIQSEREGLPKESEKSQQIEEKDAVDREYIINQITAIRNEKIPAHRNTGLGAPVWKLEQAKKIKELTALLNQ